MKHGIVWWIFIGWWWYLGVAWWLYPIMRLLSNLLRKSSNTSSNVVNNDSYRLIRETEETIIDFLKNANGETALQVDVKMSLTKQLTPYFDVAVRNLYENGKIKTSKDGNRVRLELV